MGGHLARHFARVIAYEPGGVDTCGGVGRASGLDEVSACDAVVIAVPLGAMRDVLVELAPRLRAKGSARIVADVCSVKVEPIRLMLEILPSDVEIVGTHPLFGPQSGAGGIEGLPIALCPARAGSKTLAQVRALLTDALRLRVIDADAEGHDREMAYVQGLTHYLSRALATMPLPETPLATVAYQRLLAMRANLSADSWALFETIQRGNVHAAEVRAALRRELELLESRLSGP